MSGCVLLVDDDDAVRWAIAKFLRLKGWTPVEAATVGEAETAVREQHPAAVILDYSLPDGTGLDLLRRLKPFAPDLPVVVLTAHGSIDLAVTAIKEGAYQFLTKPVDLTAVELLLQRAIETDRGRRLGLAERSREAHSALDPFVGSSPAIRELREQVERARHSPRPILLLGETGSGKGVLARYLHEHGPRSAEAMVELNCAGLSREMLESELLGHERGAFTGAVAAKAGLLEVADRGTMFLDEIGDLHLDVQPKLLTVIEDQRFRRLGAVKDRRVDVALIAATHHDLESRVQAGSFRADLYFRISAIPIWVPALRDRGHDVVELAARIVARVARELGRPELALAPASAEALRSHSWPGNLRELRNALERAALYADGGRIEPRHLAPPRPARMSGTRPRTLLAAERQHIEEILKETSGDVDLAAEILGLSRSALYEKLRKHDLGRRRGESAPPPAPAR
jgi:DNA-binding NtrC family response regulator